jgi:hypothetical protein
MSGKDATPRQKTLCKYRTISPTVSHKTTRTPQGRIGPQKKAGSRSFQRNVSLYLYTYINITLRLVAIVLDFIPLSGQKNTEHLITMANPRDYLLLFVVSSLTFAVTVIPLTLNLPRPYRSDVKPVSSDNELLHRMDPRLNAKGKTKEWLLQSSYSMSGGINETSGIYASQDSLFRGAIDAGAKHQHLVIRPDDVWLTILTQMSYYMRKHQAEKAVQDIWDNFDGKPPPRNSEWAIYNYIMDEWTGYVWKQRDKTNWLLNWVRPSFTSLLSRPMGTRKSGDEMMATSIWMASSVKAYDEIKPFPFLTGMNEVFIDHVEGVCTDTMRSRVDNKRDELMKVSPYQ